MKPDRITRPLTAALAGLALAACAESTAPAGDVHAQATGDHAHAKTAEPVTDPEVLAWLGQLRAEMTPYQDFEAAQQAGFEIKVTKCLVGESGNMGYHYGKGELLLNDVALPLAPEVLLYEPQKNGRMQLVGVEFVIPFDFYPQDQPAPVINGIEMQKNFRFNVWALHAWIFEQNPDGMFANFNPRVSCQFAGGDVE